jgi:Flp pilus assembly pilin Flp
MRRFNVTAEVRRFLAARQGATAVEYAIVTGGIAVAIVMAVTTLGSTLKTLYYDKLLNLF